MAQTEDLPPIIYNFGYWLLPEGDGQVRLGATFDRQFADHAPTDSGKQRLLAALQQRETNPAPRRIVAHHSGIRPGTADRQPFIGLHPRLPQLAIFNGFGAKGSLQIPWYAQQFVGHLIHNNPLPSYSAIDRYRTRLAAD